MTLKSDPLRKYKLYIIIQHTCVHHVTQCKKMVVCDVTDVAETSTSSKSHVLFLFHIVYVADGKLRRNLIK